MKLYNNTSSLYDVLNSINSLVKTDADLLETFLIERTIKSIVDTNNIEVIGDHAFEGCSNLILANFPVCTTIENNAFGYCANLTNFSFPACATIKSYAFYNCSNLTSVSFPACATIENYAFAYCSNLTSIYLTGSSICALGNSWAFSGTNITKTTGSIFVPSSLVASYKAATNWTYLSNRIFALEG